MKVSRCFGKFGERRCMWLLCRYDRKCRDCYWKWWTLKKKIKLNSGKEIEKFMKMNDLEYSNRKELNIVRGQPKKV